MSSPGRPLAPVDGDHPNRLRVVRLRLNKSHKEIGQILGVSGVQAGRLERGHSRLTDDHISLLSKKLNVEPWEFYADEPHDREKKMMALFRKLRPAQQDSIIKMVRPLAEEAGTLDIEPPLRKRG